MKLRLRKKLSKLPKTTCKLVTEPRFKPKFLTLKSALLTTTPNCFLQRATQKPDLQLTYCIQIKILSLPKLFSKKCLTVFLKSF